MRVVAARRLAEVRPCLQAVQAAVAAGLHAAGYIAYEAAAAFDPALPPGRPTELPLLWFGLFPGWTTPAEEPAPAACTVSDWAPRVSRQTYDAAIQTIRAAIERGDTYQVNYTIRLAARVTGDDYALYHRLHAAQGGRYGAYLNLGRHRILSASPELFFRWDGSEIVTRPMKGTAARGRWPEEDAERAAWLARSEKDRAENVMIVDLLRNDLGRVAQMGSVQVPSLFAVERYRTVYQMTSTVRALTRPGVTLEEVLAALFPCGSVTGAPKVMTMRIIAALEPEPREVYCGAIGYLEPGGEAVFNVPIRTVWLDAATGRATYGVGGGITWDSTPAGEYDELLAKAAILTEQWPAFELLETLLLADGHYALLERHLERLAGSAAYFGIPLDPGQVGQELAALAAAQPAGRWRVRLLVDQAGRVRSEGEPLQPLPFATPVPVRLADRPVSRQDRFLYHKTTQRRVYDAHRQAHPDVFDVLLWNEAGELTEFCNGNLVVELDGRLLTPARDSGLLAGTLRAELLAQGRIAEQRLGREVLARASRLWFINSVRGWAEARLVPPRAQGTSSPPRPRQPG